MRTSTVMVAIVSVLWLAFAASARASTSCAYAGAPLHTMTVNVTGESFAQITRRGEEIVANEEDRAPKPCAGGVPTVTNTDTIKVLITGRDLPFVDILLENGPLAPGATAEAEGASEIEIVVDGPGLSAGVIGTPRDDEFRWGDGGASLGLNVNPGVNGDTDVDVTVTIAGEPVFASLLSADGAGGNDTIGPDPALRKAGYVSAFGGPGNDVLTAPSGSDAYFYGGPGNDVLTGSRFADALRGEAGKDRIIGGAGADRITGGPGADRISAGMGADVIDVRDFSRDTVTCGAGRDRVTADRRDAVNGCESLRRR